MRGLRVRGLRAGDSRAGRPRLGDRSAGRSVVAVGSRVELRIREVPRGLDSRSCAVTRSSARARSSFSRRSCRSTERSAIAARPRRWAPKVVQKFRLELANVPSRENRNRVVAESGARQAKTLRSFSRSRPGCRSGPARRSGLLPDLFQAARGKVSCSAFASAASVPALWRSTVSCPLRKLELRIRP